jgi:transcriptional regulator with XRE-family HTH domain
MSRIADNTTMPTERLPPNDLPRDLPQQLLTFGQALEGAYVRAGVSKRRLAAAASLDRSAITQIERGERAPKFDKLLLLARAAKTTPAALLAGIGPRDASAQLRSGLCARHDGEPPSDSERSASAGTEGDPVERFLANLKWLREHLAPGLSQEGLALEAEIDRSSPNGYETGRMAPPRLDTILKLAAGLGVSPSVLMEGVVLEEGASTRPGTARRRG